MASVDPVTAVFMALGDRNQKSVCHFFIRTSSQHIQPLPYHLFFVLLRVPRKTRILHLVLAKMNRHLPVGMLQRYEELFKTERAERNEKDHPPPKKPALYSLTDSLFKM